MRCSKSSPGSFITFSGVDGAGKSTQIALLMTSLRERGEKPVYLWTRGGYTSMLQGLKTLARRCLGANLPPPGENPRRAAAFSRPGVRRLWLSLALMELFWLYGVQVRWHRQRGRTVLCDRYVWDTAIDFQVNFPEERLHRYFLWRLLKKVAPPPDAAFLLLVTVEESLRRSALKDEPFPAPPEVLSQRWAHYNNLRQSIPFHVLDGAQPTASLHKTILTVLHKF